MSDTVPGLDTPGGNAPAVPGNAIQAVDRRVTESATQQGAAVAAGLNARARRKHRGQAPAPTPPPERARELPEGEMTLDQLRAKVIPDGDMSLDELAAKVTPMSEESTEAFPIEADDYGWHPGKFLKGESRKAQVVESAGKTVQGGKEKGASLAAKTLGVLAKKGIR